MGAEVSQVTPPGPLPNPGLTCASEWLTLTQHNLPLLSWPLYEMVNVVACPAPHPILGCTYRYYNLDQPSLFPTPVPLSVFGFHGYAYLSLSLPPALEQISTNCGYTRVNPPGALPTHWGPKLLACMLACLPRFKPIASSPSLVH